MESVTTEEIVSHAVEPEQSLKHEQEQIKTPTPSPRAGKKMKKRISHEKNDAMVMKTESNEEHQVLEEKDIHFFPPAEGTPAAQALQGLKNTCCIYCSVIIVIIISVLISVTCVLFVANADIKVSRLEKGIRRIKGIKHPKAKNITKFMKTKNKKKAFSRNFKGKVIDGVHELYTITGMMLGLRLAVGRSNTASVQNLLLGDFSYVEKISFPPSGNNQPPFRTPPHQLAHTFKFKTYAPLVFSKLRDFFGVDSMSYMLSVCGNYNYLEFISNSKSGQFFFYSHDGRYMIKTQTNEENKFMKRILPHYYRYVTENPHTFLVRILGMHRVKMYHLNRKTHFVIMESVFDTPEPIQKVYDLKGSLVGRSASQKDRDNGGVLKDNDLIDDGVKLELGSKRKAIIDQLEKDANFLADMNIMDYSVLLGIHDRKTRHSGEVEPSQLPSRNSVGSMNKSRSILPFRLKEGQDASGSTLGDSSQLELNGTSPTKRRAQTLEAQGRKHSHGGSSKRLSCPVNLDNMPPSGLVVDEESGIHSDEESMYEYEEGEEEYEEEDSHFDAGDSDRSVCSELDFDTTTETSTDIQARFRDVAATLEDDVEEETGGRQKKRSGLTGVNLTAVGKKSGVGKLSGGGDGASSIQSSSMYATVGGSTTAGSHTDHTDHTYPSAYNSEGDSDDEEVAAGIGLAGEEGKAISKLFKDNVDLSAIASAGTRISMRAGGVVSPSNSSQEAPAIMRRYIGAASAKRNLA